MKNLTYKIRIKYTILLLFYWSIIISYFYRVRNHEIMNSCTKRIVHDTIFCAQFSKINEIRPIFLPKMATFVDVSDVESPKRLHLVKLLNKANDYHPFYSIFQHNIAFHDFRTIFFVHESNFSWFRTLIRFIYILCCRYYVGIELSERVKICP